MSSAPAYLHERLQLVLANAVKDKKYFILYRDLVRLLRDKVLRSSVSRGSPFRQAVLDAVAEEIFLKRVTFPNDRPARVCISPDGALFYANFRAIPPHRRALAAPKKRSGLFRQPAIDEYVALVAVVKSIQTALRTSGISDEGMLAVKSLHQAIRSQLVSQKAAHAENSNLFLRLNDLSSEVDQLRVQLNEMTATDDDSGEDGAHPTREQTIDLTDYEGSATNSDYEGSLLYPEESVADEENDLADPEEYVDEQHGAHVVYEGQLIDYYDGPIERGDGSSEYERTSNHPGSPINFDGFEDDLQN